MIKSIFSKKRSDLTPEELKIIRQYDNERYHNKRRKNKKEMTPEEIQIKANEKKAAKRAYDIQRRKNFTPEQKLKIKEILRLSRQKNKSRPDVRYKYLINQGKLYELQVSLTLEEYTDLISKPCYYCNDKMNTPSFGRGLDRIDNSHGYHIDNVLPCCTTCNQIRSDKFTVEETKVMILSLLDFRDNKATTNQ
jgi:hypothetical protein